MDRKRVKRRESRKVPVNDTPVEESLLIRQRLRNLFELAIVIGQKKGLLGNHKTVDTINSEGGQNVANSRAIIRGKGADVGQDQAGNQEAER